MAYELTAICDACGKRAVFRVNRYRGGSDFRPLPEGWTHVHRGGRPGVVTAEIGIACSRACLPTARRILVERRAASGARPRLTKSGGPSA